MDGFPDKMDKVFPWRTLSTKTRFRPFLVFIFGFVAEQADAPDSKSGVRKDVRVRLPPELLQEFLHPVLDIGQSC